VISSKRARQQKTLVKQQNRQVVIEVGSGQKILSPEELEQIRRVFENIRKSLTVSCQPL